MVNGFGSRSRWTVQIPELKKPFSRPVGADLMNDADKTGRDAIPLCNLLEINSLNDVIL